MTCPVMHQVHQTFVESSFRELMCPHSIVTSSIGSYFGRILKLQSTVSVKFQTLVRWRICGMHWKMEQQDKLSRNCCKLVTISTKQSIVSEDITINHVWFIMRMCKPYWMLPHSKLKKGKKLHCVHDTVNQHRRALKPWTMTHLDCS